MYRLRTFGGFSIERDRAASREIRVYRKAHALLAVLAVQGSTGRERLTALLWPESDADRARGSLKQAIHVLRRELDAPDLLLGTAELRLNPERIVSDVALFSRAVAEGDAAAAVRHYGGPFLDGVHVDGAPEFERWVDAQRLELARQYMGALERLARAAETDGEHTAAAAWWRRLQNADPLNSRVAVELMLALDASGDRAAALQHARAHGTLLRDELDIPPDPTVAALAERLRSSGAASSRGAVPTPRRPIDGAPDSAVDTPAAAGVPSSIEDVRHAPGAAGDSAARRLAAATVAVVFLLLGVVFTLTAVLNGRQDPPAAPMVAVGELEEHGGGAATGVAAAAGDMLATNLARVPGLQVVSSGRMHEIQAQLEDSAGRRGSTADAARRAGAGELLEGALYHTPDGGLRLDLRRVDLRTGAVRAAHTVDAPDVFQLVDRATGELAGGYGLSAGALHLAEVATHSLVAYRFYEEGVRDLAVADYRAAERLFDAALAEDSLFAMAAHYLWATRALQHAAVPDTARARLLRMADRAADRERLLMRATWAAGPGERSYNAAAESLANRYPAEPDGHLLLAASRIHTGDFLAALPHLQRVVDLDSLGLRGTRPRCRACDAFAVMIDAYTNVDSLPAAERTARDWVRHQPRSARAWASLATTLALQGRQDDALAARRTAATLSPIAYFDALFPAFIRIRTGEFATADGLLRDLARDGTPELQEEALWWLTISLRYQGRLRSALETIRQPPRDASIRALYPALLHEGHVLFELRRFADAARTFESAANLAHTGLSSAEEGRWKSWALTHHATALAAAGDTARLAALADTIEMWGRRSTFGRDWRLHHHVRGLLHAARGMPELAVTEFRQAIISPTSGYTRTNLELARVLLVLGRPNEAVSILQPAFRGPVEASNLAVTHTELHELLGHAWQAAKRPDSAAAHYRRVAQAWRSADPELYARRDSVRVRLATLGKPSR